jgi:hypothetical protein
MNTADPRHRVQCSIVLYRIVEWSGQLISMEKSHRGHHTLREKTAKKFLLSTSLTNSTYPPSLPTSLSGEVLSKLPVVQHLLFGSIIQCTWGAGTGAGSADRGGVFESKDGMADKSLLSKSACALNASSDSC